MIEFISVNPRKCKPSINGHLSKEETLTDVIRIKENGYIDIGVYRESGMFELVYTVIPTEPSNIISEYAAGSPKTKFPK